MIKSGSSMSHPGLTTNSEKTIDKWVKPGHGESVNIHAEAFKGVKQQNHWKPQCMMSSSSQTQLNGTTLNSTRNIFISLGYFLHQITSIGTKKSLIGEELQDGNKWPGRRERKGTTRYKTPNISSDLSVPPAFNHVLFKTLSPVWAEKAAYGDHHNVKCSTLAWSNSSIFHIYVT